MISFIIPTLNEESVLEKTLVSLREYHGPHEVIVSDGRSTDATQDIARRLADRLIVYQGTKRQTIGQGRNDGAAVARGEFLVFLDADTVIPSPDDFFRTALERFAADQRLVGFIVHLRVAPSAATLADRIIFFVGDCVHFLYNNVLHIGASPGDFQMVRTSAFRRVGGFNESLVAGEDHELFRRLARIGRTRFEWSLSVYHSGRRAHRIGWPRLLAEWFANTLWVPLFGRAKSKVWTPIR